MRMRNAVCARSVVHVVRCARTLGVLRVVRESLAEGHRAGV
jgi:hypothetical protein